jgi:glutamyl-Q tRNA(Asp) synthetase
VSDAKSSSATATTGTADPAKPYRGRFAPSPSGPLHFGSLIAAVGSFLEARARGGEWLVRIEDIDPPRERPGAADDILATLEGLGLHWDGPVLRQSTRGDAYGAALARLEAEGRVRRCHCTRAQLAALPANAGPSTDELFHPVECVAAPAAAPTPPALRFRVPAGTVRFLDRVHGEQSSDVAGSTGDFVLCRRDGLFAYQLAVVVDDAAQGITDVVRGSDLLGSTARQILLQRALGLPVLTYMHLPLAVDESGLKLSKSADAPGVSDAAPGLQLVAVLDFLRQAPPAGLERAPLREIWQWALANWRPYRFAGLAQAPVRPTALFRK